MASLISHINDLAARVRDQFNTVKTSVDGKAALGDINQWTATNTFEAKVFFNPSTASRAPLNIAQGTAPTSPTNGDLWTTSTAFYQRIGGQTKQIATFADLPVLDFGSISGVPTDNSALATALNAKADLASPILTGTVTAPTLRVSGTGNVTLGGNTHGFQIGSVAGTNISASTTTIQARNNGSASGLFLNFGGGWVYTGAELDVGAGLTVAGKISGSASTTTRATLNVPHGTAPTTPTDGDIWSTTAGLYARVNGATVGPFGAGGAAWGSITGTLSAQSDLQTALNAKAPLASPSFTGTVSAAAITASGNLTVQGNTNTIGSGTSGSTTNISVASPSGTNQIGPHLRIASGDSTGNGAGSSIYFATPSTGGVSGVTASNAFTRVTINETGLTVNNGALVAPTINHGTAVNIQHNGSTKLTTSSTGVAVTGEMSASTERLTSTTNLTLASTGHAFQIGASSTTNLVADRTGLSARSNGATSTLFLNATGGHVSAGTSLGSSGDISSTGGAVSATVGGFVGPTLKPHADRSGNDNPGANVTISSGRGTGTGTASSIILQTPSLTTSGSGSQTMSTRATIDATGLSITGNAVATSNVIAPSFRFPSGTANADFFGGQSLNGNIRFRDVDGNVRATLAMASGQLDTVAGLSVNGSSFGVNSNGLDLYGALQVAWRNASYGSFDVAIKRSAAGKLQITDGSSGYGALDTGVLTATGKVSTPASTTSAASLNVPHGTAPTSPNNGDIWSTSTGVYAQVNGVTQGLAFVSGGPLTYATNALSGTVALTNANTFYDGPTVTLGAGTWMISGHCSYAKVNSNNTEVTYKLFTASEVIASGQHSAMHDANNSGYGDLSFSGVVVLTGSTTVKFAMAANQSGTITMRNLPATNGSGLSKATQITAVKIA